MEYLLDTCICVELLRGNPITYKKFAAVGLHKCCISEITVAELLYGAKCNKNTKAEVERTLDFCNMFRVLHIEGSLEKYAEEKFRLRKQGIPIEDFDLLIGCTAISNDLILVTGNERHMRCLPVEIENWSK